VPARDNTYLSIALIVLTAGSLILFGLVAAGIRKRRRQAATRSSEHRSVQAQLLRLQKLEGLSALAGAITHDLNNLLMGIVANASLMMEEAPPGSPILTLGENALSAAEQAGNLTRQMLAYSGRDQFTIQPLSLAKQVEEISSIIRASIPKGVRLNLNLPTDLPLIAADAGQIQQVVMNLVRNGAEAIGLQGVITISAGTRVLRDGEPAGNLAGVPLTPGPYVMLEVTDTGPGMEEATQRGPGLAAVVGIVRGHRGAISVMSDAGGTAFQIFFPIERQSAAAPAIQAGRGASG
jgi:signal transduction histidine kinase